MSSPSVPFPSDSAGALAAIASPEELLHDLLAVSLTGVILYTPIYDAAGELIDFTFAYLNPAAQRMMSMPAHPTVTHMEQWPQSKAHGTFDFHVEAFVTGEPRRYDVNYQADGYDNYYCLAARRSGGGLLVSFTDTADQTRTPVEVSLRDSQAREKAARAEAEAERNLLQAVLTQAPVAICLFQGPELRIAAVNEQMGAIWGRTPEQIRGQPLLAALPELRGQGFDTLLTQVLDTQVPVTGTETPAQMLRPGQLQTTYYNFVYQPLYNAQGQIIGVIDVAVDVTEQVMARQKVQQLNQELESRVQERTAELQDKQRQLQQIMGQVPAAIATVSGPEHRYNFYNDAYQALSGGRTRAGRTVVEVFPEVVAQGFVELLDEVYRTGQPFAGTDMPVQLYDEATGEPKQRYVDFIYQPLTNEHHQANGILAFTVDVTEKVRARQQAEQSAQQVRALVESAPFPIGVCVGPDLRIELANQAMLEGWGKGPNVLGKRFAEVLPELESQPIFEQLHQVLASGQPVHMRNQRLEMILEGTPQTVYYNYSFTPLRDVSGHVYGVLNTAADVTDLALAQQRIEAAAAELQESEARFRTMADAAPNMVWAVHPDSSIRYINRAFLDFVGLAHEHEYLAAGWTHYLHPDELELTQQTLTHAIQHRELYSLEHRMLRHDGEFRWLLAQGAPSYYPNGDLYGYVGSAVDITDLKQANEQLTRTNVDLDNFIYSASHDLKAPISNIEGLLYLLREELSPKWPMGSTSHPRWYACSNQWSALNVPSTTSLK